MKKLSALLISIVLASLALHSRASAAEIDPPAAVGTQPDSSAKRGGLMARVNRVKVLSFNTDKPVREARLIINGKQVASDSWQSDSPGFKLAVITPPSKDPRYPEVKQEVQVHVEVSSMGGYMAGPYRERREVNVLQQEYFGPGTNVVLNGWTKVYGLSQMMGANQVYDLQIDIR